VSKQLKNNVNTEKHGNCAWVSLLILALCAESIHGLTLPQCPTGLFHCQQKRHAGMWLAVMYTPSSSRKKTLYRVYKWQVYNFKLFSIGVPVPDQNIPMETNIIPDNKPGLL
jgi:hypothetical protein